MAISAMRARGFGEEKQKTDGIKPRDILSDSRIFFLFSWLTSARAISAEMAISVGGRV